MLAKPMQLQQHILCNFVVRASHFVKYEWFFYKILSQCFHLWFFVFKLKFHKNLKRDTAGTTRNYDCVASCIQSTSLDCCQTRNCNKIIPLTNVTSCSVGSVKSDQTPTVEETTCPSTANKFCKVKKIIEPKYWNS